MRIRKTVKLDCKPQEAWAELKRPETLNRITRPIATFEPVDPEQFPRRWIPGQYVTNLKLFGLIPVVNQSMKISYPKYKDGYQLRDKGTSRLPIEWDHKMTVEASDDGGTWYTDEVELDAGRLTPIAWAYGQLFFRYRQWRWQKLAQQDHGQHAKPSYS